MKKLFLLAVASFTFIAAPAMAKEGGYIGAFLIPSASISVGSVDSGSGWGLRAGLGFNRYLALEGTYVKTKHDRTGGTADLTGLAADFKLNFPLTSLDSYNVMTLEPYVLLGYGINYDLKFENGQSSSGSGGRFGLGIELYLFKELSVNAGWTRTNVSFDGPVNTDGAVRVFDAGLIYHFF